MQSRSGTKKSTRPATSPAKQSRTTTQVNEDGSRVTTTVTTKRFTTTHLNQAEYDTLQLLLKEKEIELNNKLGILVGLEERQAVLDDLKRDLSENQRMIRESDGSRQELQEQFVITSRKLEEDTDMKTKYSESLIEEIKQLKEELQNRNRAYAKREQEHIDQMARQQQQHSDELNRLERECADTVAKNKKECTDTVLRLEKDCSDQIARLTQQHSEEMKRLQTEHSIAYEELRDTKDKKIDTLELNLRKCQQTIVSLESTILKLNITLTEKQDVEKERDLWIHRHNDIEAAKLELSTQLQGASEYILQLESKYYESNQDQLEMLKQLKSHEAEIDNLRQYIIDLKSRIAVYIPVKGDTIDKKLAEYINNYPDRQKLKIMFMRESEGVYQFGTKKVYVKCVKDKIEIKVGGGFLSLDEFLDQYTPVELEKLERKDPVRRMTDRIALQKTLKGTAVREDVSPNRGSPTRKKTAV